MGLIVFEVLLEWYYSIGAGIIQALDPYDKGKRVNSKALEPIIQGNIPYCKGK